MRILVVEDDMSYAASLKRHLESMPGNISVTSVGDAASAEEKLSRDEHWDLVILDATLPSSPGALDASVDVGRRVFADIQQKAPGLPVYFLTASPTETIITEVVDAGNKADIWGTGRPEPVVRVCRKLDLSRVLDELRKVAGAFLTTSAIDISTFGKDLGLSDSDRRIVKVFAARRGGALCEVKPISSGQSNSKVLRLKVKGKDGSHCISVVAKLSTHDRIEDEQRKYEQYAPRLKHGTYAVKADVIPYGGCKKAGLFYALLDGYDRSMFDLLGSNASRAAEAVAEVQAATAPWCDAVPFSERCLRDIRRRLVADATLDRIVDEFPEVAWVRDEDEMPIRSRWGVCHGDLHGGNILIGSDDRPTLIDFGDVGPGPCCMDPVTLELSVLFHRDGRAVSEGLRSNFNSRVWLNPEKACNGHPYLQFFSQCREWGYATSAGERDLVASALAYVVRQLKYGRDNELALSMVSLFRDCLKS